MSISGAPPLIAAILAASANGREEADLHIATEAIRQAIVAVGCETPDNLACANTIDFGLGFGANSTRRIGLRLAGSDILLSDVLWALEDASMPATVSATFPSLTDDSWAAVTRLLTLIAVSLEAER